MAKTDKTPFYWPFFWILSFVLSMVEYIVMVPVALGVAHFGVPVFVGTFISASIAAFLFGLIYRKRKTNQSSSIKFCLHLAFSTALIQQAFIVLLVFKNSYTDGTINWNAIGEFALPMASNVFSNLSGFFLGLAISLRIWKSELPKDPTTAYRPEQ